MATGEIKWSSQGKKIERFERTPLPKGDYDLKFNANDITQEKGEKPGQVPYINVPLEVLGTATGDNGKNRKIFTRFFLHLAPGKDGKNMLERQGGLLDLARALGEELTFTGIQVPYQKYDAEGNRVGEMTRIPIVDPAQALKWLKAHDGAVARAHVKVERPQNGFDAKNAVEYFIAAEASETPDEEYKMEEDVLEDPTSIETEEPEEDVEEEEVKPKKAVGKKR